MTDAALLELRQLRAELPHLVALAVRDELAELRRLVGRLAPAPPPAHAELLEALADTFDGAFGSSEVIELARLRLTTRQPLRDALAALAINTAHKLGMVLARLADNTRGQPLRLVRAGDEAHSRLWLIERDAGS